MNPAFAGTIKKTNIHLNAREQWLGMNGSIFTNTFSIDQNLENANSGIGLVFTQIKQGQAPIKNHYLSGIYSYMININKDWAFSMGAQATYIRSVFNSEAYLFSDQINSDFTINAVSVELSEQDYRAKNALGLSFGGILYKKNFWVGLSAFNLNSPKAYLIDGRVSPRLSVQSGYTYNYNKNSLYKKYDIVITPTLNINYQKPFMRIGGGVVINYHVLTLGSYISNINIENGGGNNILNSTWLLGYADDNFKIGYSYDFRVLGDAKFGGSHEISFGIWLDYENYSKKNPLENKKNRKISCPKF